MSIAMMKPHLVLVIQNADYLGLGLKIPMIAYLSSIP